MKKPIILIAILVTILGIVGVAVTSSNKPMNESMDMSASNNMQMPEQNEVFMQDFEFTPKNLTIKKGTKITWTNKDNARHDVKPDSDYGQAFTPSELMAKDESYSFTFDTPGTYNYHCTPHPYMKATIEVTE
jgi:amicyanin